MSKKSTLKLLQQANDKFALQEYESAMLNFSLVLKDEPNNEDARIGVILSEMAQSKEEGAQALFDYYEVLRQEDQEGAVEIIESLVESLETGLDELTELLEQPLRDQLLMEDGILYEDFKLIVQERGDFRRSFEDIMFSTKVIITQREDFLDFLENLIDNDFYDMASNYIEGAMEVFPNDERLRTLFEKLNEREPIENSTS
jgi:tetratricopeptide (TPR) repeat protein